MTIKKEPYPGQYALVRGVPHRVTGIAERSTVVFFEAITKEKKCPHCGESTGEKEDFNAILTSPLFRENVVLLVPSEHTDNSIQRE